MSEPDLNKRRLPVSPSAMRGSETILVVEDEDMLREMEREILRGCGYHVLEAASGQEALNLLSGYPEKIDLLLTDIVMPDGISGAELAKQLLARLPQLKVIFTSGYNTHEAKKNMPPEMHARFLSKPYGQADLTKIVRDSLDQNGVNH